MGKTRMGLLDLRVQTAKLNATLSGAQVTNIYDASNGRTYILKLSIPPKRSSSTDASPDISSLSSIHSSWEKRLLLLESGVRLHMTQYDREKDVPSGFCLKLRKHIRTRRLESVRLLGNGGDRIIDISFFGEGSVCAHLIVEAFAGGNVILTTGDYTILTLLRTYNVSISEAESTRVAVRERYPVENARSLKALDFDSFHSAASRALAAAPSEDAVSKASGRVARRKMYARGVAKKALAIELAIEPNLLEHALITAGFPANVPLDTLVKLGEDALYSVYDALIKTETELVEEMSRGEMKGYIVIGSKNTSQGPKEIYEEFSPYLFAQYRDLQYKEYTTFDEAADEYFTRLEVERVEGAQAKRETAAFSKVDKLQNELDGQVSVFENAKDKSLQLAQAIEANIVEVDAALTVIRSAIAAAIPWDGLAQMVKDEKRKGNPVAEIIHSLQLESNKMTLLLEDTFENDETEEALDIDDYEDDDDDENDVGEGEGESENGSDDSVDEFGEKIAPEGKNRKPARIFRSSPGTRNALLVPVDIDLSAYANARRHYEMRKSAAAKMEKAVEVKDRTIKAATKRAAKEAKRLEEKATAASARAMRKPLWFEKFHWFVSQENYLVLAGRDMQQNDLLIKRHMGPADIYVHADVDNAGSVIIKNRRQPGTSSYAEIPQLTLDQAGMFAMCRSVAWDSNIVTSAWWVRAIQVSKTTSTGQYLPDGSFAIRGKKNFLNPTQLVMGIAFMFKVDESSAAKHQGERGLKDGPRSSDFPAGISDVHLKCTKADGSKIQDISDIGDHGSQRGLEPKPCVVTPNREATTSFGAEKNEDRPTDECLKSPLPATGTHEVMAGGSKEQEIGGVRVAALQISTEAQMFVKNQSVFNTEKEPATSSLQTPEEGNATSKGPKPKSALKSKGSTSLPRGKKHKLKKMKKYGDQDEEERRIALAVLGSKPIKEELSENSSGAGTIGTDYDNQMNKQEPTDSKQRSEGSRSRERREEDLLLLDTGGLMELERLEVETSDVLNLLTAIPTPDDAVEYALPVCAPYSAVSQYRYRVKMMPGSMKRGNAYRAAVALFQRQAEKDLDIHKQERDAMRFCPERDGIHSMLGNVKLMAPGLADAQKMLMKSKKASLASKKGGKQK